MNEPCWMQSSENRRWHDVAYWGLLLVACVMFFWMNVLTPFKEDDMLHSLVIGDLTHVNSIGDLLHSYRNKFFITNGRTSDMVAELFCGLLGKPLFNVCNALMFGLLAYVVSLLATGRRSLLAQAILYACIGTCYPVPGETMLWLAGSCNYLWSITGSLWVLYFLLHHRQATLGWGKGLLLFFGAMLAGAGNEAISFGLFGGLFLYFAFNRHKIDRMVVVGMAGYLLGVLLIMSSPAAWERASDGGIVVNLPLMELLFSRCFIVGEKMLRFVVPIVAFAVLIVLLFRKGFKAFKSSVWPYLLVMLTLILLALGLNPERPYAGLVTVSIIITIMAVDILLRRWPPLRALAVLACLAVAGWTFSRGVVVLGEYKAHEQRVIDGIRSAPAQAILHESPFTGHSPFLYTLPMQSDNYFTNEYIWRAFFDKENVQFVSDSVYARFHDGRLTDGAVEMPFTSDRPDVAGRVVAFPDQDYMLLTLQCDTLPTAYQMGWAYWNESQQVLSEQEQAYRRQHGVGAASDPFCYYPLLYQGEVLMVLPVFDNAVSSALLLLDYAGENLLTLQRQAPNPPEVKQPSR